MAKINIYINTLYWFMLYSTGTIVLVFCLTNILHFANFRNVLFAYNDSVNSMYLIIYFTINMKVILSCLPFVNSVFKSIGMLEIVAEQLWNIF